MVSFLRTSLFCLLLAASTTSSWAAEPISCTIIVEVRSAEVLVRDGVCDQRVPPFSSFKLPLAVMGFETGILIDGHSPRWDWTADVTAPERDRKSVDPIAWERDSVLWYSRKLVQSMGDETFAGLVHRLEYGNQDVSGVPGKANGMTHAWIGASLAISPEEQVHFVRRLLLGDLPVSAAARRNAAAILPSFAAKDGWVLTGKTGSGWLTDSTGAYRRDRSLGWFVGWANRGDEHVAFARLLVDNRARGGALGLTLRDSLVADLPGLLAR